MSFSELKLKYKKVKAKYEKLQLRSKAEALKIPFQFFYAPFMILYLEIILKFYCFGGMSGLSFFYTFMFSMTAGFFISAVCSFFSKKINTRLFTIFLSGISIIFIIQIIYYRVFKTFTTLFSAAAGTGRIFEYWREILKAVGSSLIILFLTILPIIIWMIFIRYTIPKKRSYHRIIFSAGLSFLLLVSTSIVVSVSFQGDISPRYLYKNTFISDLSVKQFGMMTMLRLDIKNLLFGSGEMLSLELADEAAFEIPLPGYTVSETSFEKGDTESEKETAGGNISSGEMDSQNESSANEIPSSDTETMPLKPIVYENQVLNIDFDQLIEESNNDTLRTMHEYFNNISPSKQNEYTGMFEGKNLVWFCAEGFSTLTLDPECTPVLTKLAKEGFVFENFYNPVWGVSTSDGEYTTCTGLIPKSGVWSFYLSGKNFMPFAMGTQLQKQNYITNAYHNNTYDYYNRHISHPNMGYQYTAIGNGLVMEKKWPRSDLEMLEKTLPEYIDKENFHTYYMTISGHLNYDFSGNAMSYRHMDKVEHLPYSEGPKAYIACNIELELAVEYLIEELSKKGILDDTVIVLSGDHYPYGLSPEQMAELAGHEIEQEFEMYKSTLILWNAAMEEPVNIEKVCSPIDILPTLSNLFGLEYDSRLLIGRDILSDAQGLVMFQNRSWLTDYARYNAAAGKFIPNESEKLPENYQDAVTAQVKNKFDISAKILDMNYYKVVLE